MGRLQSSPVQPNEHRQAIEPDSRLQTPPLKQSISGQDLAEISLHLKKGLINGLLLIEIPTLSHSIPSGTCTMAHDRAADIWPRFRTCPRTSHTIHIDRPHTRLGIYIPTRSSSYQRIRIHLSSIRGMTATLRNVSLGIY